jgi:hypothetical protein
MASDLIDPTHETEFEDAETGDDGALRKTELESGSVKRIRYDQSWLSSFLRPILIAVLVACINIAFGAFLARFVPESPPGLFGLIVVLGVVAALIATASTAWLAQPDQRLNRTVAYRSAEFALIVMLVRLGLWLIPGVGPTWEELFLHPIDAIFDGYFILATLVVLFSWFWAIDFSADLLSMALQADELYLADTTTQSTYDAARPASTNRQAILDRFTTRWMVGGLILITLAAGSQVDVGSNAMWSLMRQPVDPVVILAIIAYFFAGLLLISQGQLAILRARWTLERIPTSEAIARNWPLYVLLLLGMIGILAALLPLGGTQQLSQLLTMLINGIYVAVYTFYRLVFLLILALLSLLPFISEETELPDAPPPVEEAPPAQFIEPLPFLDWAGGFLFWGMTLFLLINAALIYFGAHKTGLTWLANFWLRLKEFWQQLFGSLSRWQQTRLALPEEQAGPGRSMRMRLQDWFQQQRHGTLTPEQRIRYYYLAMLEQAERYGMPRTSSETPSHYAPRLHDVLHPDDAVAGERSPQDMPGQAEGPGSAEFRADPSVMPGAYASQTPTETDKTAEGEDEVGALTAEFERVRYAGARVDPEEAARVADIYARLRKLLGA